MNLLSIAALAPFRHGAYRLLWSAWIIAATSMWMNDVAAAWTMTALTTSPVWVALVQTASTLPVFLLGLPSGALADSLDRRRVFIATQAWVAGVAVLLFSASLSGALAPPVLLALVFANGIGLAMRWPAYAASVPELVPRSDLPAALALNGVAMNASRILGPLLAGAIIASIGIEYVFALNAALSLLVALLVCRWRRPAPPPPCAHEGLVAAVLTGLRYAAQSTRMRAVLVRVTLFFFHSTALLALLPLLARETHRGDAGTYTLLFACMGIGAIGTVGLLPRLRQATTRDARVVGGAVLQSAAALTVAFAPHLAIACLAMLAAGMAWITTANSLSVSAQLTLPDWIRARGMSMFQMALMGSSALGAALWGKVAAIASVQASLAIAAGSSVVSMLLVQRLVTDPGFQDDVGPSGEIGASHVRQEKTN